MIGVKLRSTAALARDTRAAPNTKLTVVPAERLCGGGAAVGARAGTHPLSACGKLGPAPPSPDVKSGSDVRDDNIWFHPQPVRPADGKLTMRAEQTVSARRV